LNHLVGRLSDALQCVSVLKKSRPARVKEYDRDHVPAAGALLWSRANRPSARVRQDAASPPRPCASWSRASSSYRVAREYGLSSRLMISTEPSSCSSALAQSPLFANTRPIFARAVDTARGSPIVVAKARARSALDAASSTASTRRKLSS